MTVGELKNYLDAWADDIEIFIVDNNEIDRTKDFRPASILVPTEDFDIKAIIVLIREDKKNERL